MSWFSKEKKGLTVKIRNSDGLLIVKAENEAAQVVINLTMSSVATTTKQFTGSNPKTKTFEFMDECNIAVMGELVICIFEGYLMTID